LVFSCSKSSNEIMPARPLDTAPLSKTTSVNYQLVSFSILAKSNVWSPFYGYVNQVKLTWKAKNETQILNYELERSFNGGAWTYSGQWPASSSSTAITRSYSVICNTGNHSFRMKILHIDSTSTYSPVRYASF
jgi:hypothetical protein